MAFETITVEIADEIGTVTLNRPEKLNAWTPGMGAEITEALRGLDRDPSVRVAVLTGAGDRAFCAGADMDFFAAQIAGGGGTAARGEAGAGPAHVAELPRLMRGFSKPTIAALNGYALGVGATIPLLCDVRIAAEEAKIGFLFSRMGVMAELGSTFIVPRLVGIARACELMLTGKMFTAAEVERMGLVNRVVPRSELGTAVREIAAEMRKCAPLSLQLTRQASGSMEPSKSRCAPSPSRSISCTAPRITPRRWRRSARSVRPASAAPEASGIAKGSKSVLTDWAVRTEDPIVQRRNVAMASPELQIVIQQLKSQPLLEVPSIAEMRAGLEAMAGAFPLAPDATCEKVDAGGVPAEWITVPGADSTSAILYLHGGGYVVGSINSHRGLASRLSRAAGARALAIDYRLAPEHPFPAAVDDATTAYRWLVKRGVSPRRIVIAGDSAGGGLAVATLVNLRDQGDPLPAAGVCLSPWVDLEGIGESMTARAHLDPMVQKEGLQMLARHYLGKADARSPLAAPLYADLSGLPPLYIQVGTAETLYDDSTRLAERARKAGVDVTLEPWEEMIHVFQLFAAMLPEGREAIERIGAFVRRQVT